MAICLGLLRDARNDSNIRVGILVNAPALMPYTPATSEIFQFSPTFLRRFTASASIFNNGTVSSQAIQASVTLCP